MLKVFARLTLSLFFFLPIAVFAQTASSIIPDSVKKQDTIHQRDLIDIAKSLVRIPSQKMKTEKDKKLYFSFLPFGGNVPGGNGRALITSTTAGTYLGSRETTYESTANFAPYWNLGSRFGLPLHTSVWLPGNTYTVQGDIRFLRYPQYTWGLGNNTDDDHRTLVDYNYVRFYQSVLKRIRPYLFAGVGYDLDFHSGIHSDEQSTDLKQFTGYNNGTAGSSFSSGITFNLLYDTRNNAVNPLPGAYTNIIYRVNPTFLGSNNYWTSLYVDVRKYVPLNPAKPLQQNTIAFWSYFWTTFNGNVPYLDLPSIGWDPNNRSGRGMDQNRYKGRSLFYFETEYRRDITENGLLGFVVFTSVNSVSGSGSLFTSWHPAAGTGLRVKFNKGSGTNIGIDYGFSKGYNAISLNLGEAF
ncbi:BamA/TamA family outer membrane protein [Mucilaginibacter corticis]|uniref:BamA/TamA family outer membrane protein n=2 Tax=Mucilaginibacter corticis TaxID=2597670 RepID=A0A556MG81_9SPHI|nr:BamA/TamA family outer membrane protein [Mucilaginibacter corticis]